MTPTEVMLTIEGLISISVLIGVFYGPWQTIVVDYGRQYLFEIRDSFFDLAAKGEIDFDSDEYAEIRDTMNSLIRFLHRLTWPRMFVVHHFSKRWIDAKNVKRLADISTNQAMKTKLRHKEREILMIVLITIYLRSPLLIIVTPVALPAVLLFIMLNAPRRQYIERQVVVHGSRLVQEARLSP